MHVLLDFPEIVQAYAPHFEGCFSPEGYRHFQRMVSGLLVGTNHTLTGINSLFALDVTHQSSLNRFVNRQNFSLAEVHRCRLSLMEQCPATALKAGGCLAIDSTLLHHRGTHFDGITPLWDYVNKTYSPAHDLVSLYYVDDQTDYPLSYQLWQPADWEAVAEHIRRLDLTIKQDRWDKRNEDRKGWHKYIRTRFSLLEPKYPQLRQTYKSKIHLAEDLLRQWIATQPAFNLPVVIDSGFASDQFCRTVSEEFKLDYVADVKAKQVIYRSGNEKISLAGFVEALKSSHNQVTPRNPKGKPSFTKVSYGYRGKRKTAYVYVGVHRFRSYAKKQKLIIYYNNEELKGEPRLTITNRLNWYPSQILRIRRLRWPIETYHQEAKAQGLESYQVRNEKAIQTHIAFVVVAYTMLSRATQDEALLKQLRERIQTDADHSTLPFLRRLLQSSAMWTIAQHIYLNAQSGAPLEEVMRPILRAIAQL